jgi:hypothetical protein
MAEHDRALTACRTSHQHLIRELCHPDQRVSESVTDIPAVAHQLILPQDGPLVRRINVARGHWQPSAAPARRWRVAIATGQDRYQIFAITCPFHDNAGWRWIRDNDPQGWAEAVAFDKAIRHGYPHATDHGQPLRGQYFLHCSCRPLEVYLDPPTPAEGHLRLVTGSTAQKEDDPDGCSPWACRSGAPVIEERAA